jgi:transcriptional regulator with XRE-family HTH domain
MDKAKAFGIRVEKMRTRRHLSTQDLAERTGLSYQSLWRIERGQHKEPGVFTTAKIARALGCTTDYLIGMQEDEENEPQPTAAALIGV